MGFSIPKTTSNDVKSQRKLALHSNKPKCDDSVVGAVEYHTVMCLSMWSHVLVLLWSGCETFIRQSHTGGSGTLLCLSSLCFCCFQDVRM